MAGIGKASTNIESIAGVLISGKVPTTAAGGGSNVAVVNISGDVRVTGGNVPLAISAAGVARVSGQIKTTAVGAGGASMAITNVSGQVPVTAGNIPLPVNIVQTSGQIQVTAPTNLPVNVANVSGQIPVTAGGVPLPVNIVQTSAQIHVTAGNAPIQVSVAGVNHAVSSLGVQAGLRGDMVFNALVSNPVKFGKLPQVAGAVCADIVAAVASRKIRVLGAYLNSTGTATAIFMTTGASAALTPKIAMNTGFVLPVNPHGWFETAVGSALSLQIEGGSIGGIITYQEVV